MAARGHHIFTRDERALVHRFIDAGEFRDVAEFEEFAIRRALAQLRLQELYDLRKATGVRPISLQRILHETRKVRRQMWKVRFPRDAGKKEEIRPRALKNRASKTSPPHSARPPRDD